MKISSILGLNARTQLFAYKYNTREGKKVADSKIQTARALKGAHIPHPRIYEKFRKPEDALGFDWSKLPDRFALKPSRGLGGQGIIVIKKRLRNKQSLAKSEFGKQSLASQGPGKQIWITTNRERVTEDDLKLHTLDILEGAYSLGNEPDVAFIQEYVGRAKAFKRWAYRGTPDIRVIVFNKVPIMAMLRLPTKESGGRANLHQGALGVGIDTASGRTTKAIWHGEQIVYKPGTQRKLRGIKIPDWTNVLETAVNAQIASGLGYLGVDIVIHPDKGPMVLELNAQPGLQIQLANMEGIKKRLERVEDLDVRDAEHGVKIAQALFTSRYITEKKAREKISVIGAFENIKIRGEDGKKVEVPAKIDTGAYRTSIDRNLAKSLGLTKADNVLWYRKTRSALGVEERPVIRFIYWLKGRKIVTSAGLADRRNLKKQVIIGRLDLAGFAINLSQNE